MYRIHSDVRGLPEEVLQDFPEVQIDQKGYLPRAEMLGAKARRQQARMGRLPTVGQSFAADPSCATDNGTTPRWFRRTARQFAEPAHDP